MSPEVLLMKLKKWEIALICALALTFLCGTALAKEQEALSEKLIRIHVVANSDSDEDQTLKLQVRDRILEYLNTLLKGTADREKAVKIIESQMESIIDASEAVIHENGNGCQVTAQIMTEYFPTRAYDTFSLPAGKYISLRVVIGAGGGRNWWCVIFPPLCMTAAAADSEAFGELTDEQIRLITSDEPKYVIKFKSIEWLNKIRAWLGL
jgi:stage II sporulation protein R